MLEEVSRPEEKGLTSSKFVSFIRQSLSTPPLPSSRPPNATQDRVDRRRPTTTISSHLRLDRRSVRLISETRRSPHARALNIRLPVDEYFLINPMDVWNGSLPETILPTHLCLYTVHLSPGRSLYLCSTKWCVCNILPYYCIYHVTILLKYHNTYLDIIQ